MANQKEIIPFTASASENISWTPTRATLFGLFPEVEVYIQDPGGVYYKAAIQPVPDAPPPSFTQLVVDMGGSPQTGFILLM